MGVRRSATTLEERLIEVGWPLLAEIRESPAEWRPVLELLAFVWNALVHLQPKSVICAELRSHFGARDDAEALVDLLAARKCELYPEDRREISNIVHG